MTRLILSGIACVALAMSAWSGTASAESGKKKIATEQEFLDMVAGKKIANDHGHSIAHPDGTISGAFQGKKMTGTWDWEDRYFCRAAVWGKKVFGRQCQTVTVSDNKVTFGRDKGKGKKVGYRLEEP